METSRDAAAARTTLSGGTADVLVIGVTGFKGSGKDELFKYVESTRRGVVRRALADPLKEMMVPLFGWSERQLWGDLKEDVDPLWGFSPRQMMQVMGTEVFRNTLPGLVPGFPGKDFWVKCLRVRIDKLVREQPWVRVIVVPDVRMPNENALLAEFPRYVSVRVNRFGGTADLHESEIHIPTLGVMHEVDNRGTLEEFYRRIELELGGVLPKD